MNRRIALVMMVVTALWLAPGAAVLAGSGEAGTTYWEYDVTEAITSSPAISAGGIVYVGAGDFRLHALNADGSKRWEFATNGEVNSSPAVGVNGTIFFTSLDNKIYAVSNEGAELWQYEMGPASSPVEPASSPAVAPDGTVYVGWYDSRVYSFTNDGTENWNFVTGGPVRSSPAIAVDGTILVGSDDGFLYAFLPDGTLDWTFETGGPIVSSPAVDTDGTVYVGSDDGYVYALTSTGALKWSFHTEAEVRASPILGPDGAVFVGTLGEEFFALDADGVEKWRYTVPDDGQVSSTAALGADGALYFGTSAGAVLALDSTNGNLLWQFGAGGAVASSPAISPTGVLYVGSNANNLLALYCDSNGLATSDWPAFRHENRNSGSVLRGGLLVAAGMTPAPSGSLTSGPSEIVIQFSNYLDPATVSLDMVQVLRSGGDAIFGNANDFTITPSSVSITDNASLTISLAGASMPEDAYQVTVTDSLRDVDGNFLDGEYVSSFPTGDSHIGGDFVAIFYIGTAIVTGGGLDVTYGLGGYQVVDSGREDVVRDIVTVPVSAPSAAEDMRGMTVATGYVVGASGNRQMALWRIDGDGEVDASFGGGSGRIAFASPTGGNAEGYAVGIDAAGNIVVAGYVTDGGQRDAAIWRIQPDGLPDTDFDDDGLAVFGGDDGFGSSGVDAGDDEARDLVTGGSSSSPTYLLAGYSTALTGGTQAALWKVTGDGSLVPSFGVAGAARLDPVGSGERYEIAHGLTQSPGGDIFVAGSSGGGPLARTERDNTRDMVIWKTDSDGATDKTFGDLGLAILTGLAGGLSGSSDGEDVASAIVLDGAGRPVICGWGTTGTGDMDVILLRLSASSGALDTTFGLSKGYYVSDGGASRPRSNDYAMDLVLDDRRNIVVTGYSGNATGDWDMTLYRFEQDGAPDSGFGLDGHVSHSSAAGGFGDDAGSGIALSTDGEYLIGGYSDGGGIGGLDAAFWNFQQSTTGVQPPWYEWATIEVLSPEPYELVPGVDGVTIKWRTNVPESVNAGITIYYTGQQLDADASGFIDGVLETAISANETTEITIDPDELDLRNGSYSIYLSLDAGSVQVFSKAVINAFWYHDGEVPFAVPGVVPTNPVPFAFDGSSGSPGYTFDEGMEVNIAGYFRYGHITFGLFASPEDTVEIDENGVLTDPETDPAAWSGSYPIMIGYGSEEPATQRFHWDTRNIPSDVYYIRAWGAEVYAVEGDVEGLIGSSNAASSSFWFNTVGETGTTGRGVYQIRNVELSDWYQRVVIDHGGEHADDTSPKVYITTPESGYTTNESTVTVRGEAFDPSGVSQVWVNGKLASIDGSGGYDKWYYVMELEEGSNIVEAIAVDAGGEQTRRPAVIVIKRELVIEDTTDDTSDTSTTDTDGSPVMALPVQVSLGESVYRPGQRHVLRLTVQGVAAAAKPRTVYAAVAVPGGGFFCLSGVNAFHPEGQVLPMTRLVAGQTLRGAMALGADATMDQSTIAAVDLILPAGMPEGDYLWMAAAVEDGKEVTGEDIDSVSFEFLGF